MNARRSIVISLGLLFLPLYAYAALVNINTADAALLDTLPGIGPSKAAAIIDYRTQHGPFARIEDIQNVSGIGSSTYADIASMITVGAATTPITASSTPSASPTGSAQANSPPPSSLSVETVGSHAATIGVPLRLSARVMMKSGGVDTAARLFWNFGDGSVAEGNPVEKTYRYAGTYLVTAVAVDGIASARDEFIVSAKPSAVRIALVSSEGITLANDAEDRLDLSGWRLATPDGSFRFPENTMLLPHANVLFPYAITGLPISFEASLLSPNGTIVARYAPLLNADEQPSVVVPSYKKVQAVEPIISEVTNVPSYAEAALAPAAPAEPAEAAGAPLPQTAAAVDARLPGFLQSPWTLGFFAVMVLAGAVFILL